MIAFNQQCSPGCRQRKHHKQDRQTGRAVFQPVKTAAGCAGLFAQCDPLDGFCRAQALPNDHSLLLGFSRRKPAAGNQLIDGNLAANPPAHKLIQDRVHNAADHSRTDRTARVGINLHHADYFAVQAGYIALHQPCRQNTFRKIIRDDHRRGNLISIHSRPGGCVIIHCTGLNQFGQFLRIKSLNQVRAQITRIVIDNHNRNVSQSGTPAAAHSAKRCCNHQRQRQRRCQHQDQPHRVPKVDQ